MVGYEEIIPANVFCLRDANHFSPTVPLSIQHVTRELTREKRLSMLINVVSYDIRANGVVPAIQYADETG